MGKKYSQIIALFTILLVALNIFTGGSADESQKYLVRQIRSVVCLFGLTGLVSDAFYEALKAIQKFDPVPIHFSLNDRLQNGILEGLSSLHNDSTINVDCDDESVVISTTLDVRGASISYQWKQNLLLFTLDGSTWTKTKDIQLALELTLNTTDGIKLDLSNLKLTNIEGLTFGIKGLGLLNPVVDILGTVVLNLWKHGVTHKIEELLRTALESQLSTFQISF